MYAFPQFNRLKQCRHGQMLYNANDVYIGRSLDLYGEYAPGELEVFRQVVQPGNVVVDVGANIGAHTLFFAQQVGPTGLVLAFEPQRVVFQTLCANLALNSVTNAFCFQQAIGAAAGSVRVPRLDYTKENNFGALDLAAVESGEQVTMVTLDSFRLGRCEVLKIDVEGMELDVLRGAAGLIEANKPTIYVENDRAEKSAALIRHLADLDYAMYWHRAPYFHAQNFRGNTHNAFPGVVAVNMLCIHRSHPHKMQGLQAVIVPSV